MEELDQAALAVLAKAAKEAIVLVMLRYPEQPDMAVSVEPEALPELVVTEKAEPVELAVWQAKAALAQAVMQRIVRIVVM